LLLHIRAYAPILLLVVTVAVISAASIFIRRCDSVIPLARPDGFVQCRVSARAHG
jgi:hypothetical protein